LRVLAYNRGEVKIAMRHLQRIGLMGSLLSVVLLSGCKPAATPAPLAPSPTPAAVQPQVVPDATLELPANSISTAAPTAVAVSGLRIIAKVGPTCPGPERPGQVCEAPYEGEFSITTATGTAAARVVSTDKDGQVTVDLPPGQYTITPKIEGRLPSGAPVDVTVLPGQIVEVNLELDSGMR
jgi:hypothetical protein